MKQRLLSVLLLLALITGLTALLPLGVVAEAPATAAAQSGVIYAEDFSALKPGVYKADKLTEALGWSSIGTTPNATYQITDDGKLRLVSFGEIPTETNYLVEEDGDAITFGGDRILV